MVTDNDDYQERPSKSARKRESHALQDLGTALIALKDDLLAELPLPDILRDAILAARTMTSHGAQARQRQYIGKLMRKIDADAIRAALDQQTDRQKQAARLSSKLAKP